MPAEKTTIFSSFKQMISDIYYYLFLLYGNLSVLQEIKQKK